LNCANNFCEGNDCKSANSNKNSKKEYKFFHQRKGCLLWICQKRAKENKTVKGN
jgi:hypothetical protein